MVNSPASRFLAAAVAFLVAVGVAASIYLFTTWFRPVPAQVRTVDPGNAAIRQVVQVPIVLFEDVTRARGVTFTHRNGAFGKKLLPETMGSGVAVIDFDADGRPDLLFVNSRSWPGRDVGNGSPATLAFYRNEANGQLTDVTAAVGLDVSMYGMGATVGDYDNDGWPDLFVTGVGGNRLFRNVATPRDKGSNGRAFVDVTARAQVGGPGGWPTDGKTDFTSHAAPLNWSTSASFLDYDGDGKLDLFVCNYVTWSPTIDLKQSFTLNGRDRAYGPPVAFDGAQNLLYRNRGDGSFEDVSAAAGVRVVQRGGTDTDKTLLNVGKSLGVIACDVDEDGWPDLVVANDTVRNFLFHNVAGADGKRRFEELGTESGVAYAEGSARGAMGIDWAPSIRPGMNALIIGNFADEPNTYLCREDKDGLVFTDRALAEGIAGPSRRLLKFSTLFLDYDLDGRLDLLTCNGHLEPEITSLQKGQQYAQPVQLFWNTGQTPRGFEPVPELAVGADLFQPLVGRGAASADLDGNGTLDLVLTANDGPARVLRNQGGTGHHWLRLRLQGDGQRSNRSAIGARVLLQAGGTTQFREIAAARGYLSASELTVSFGLGKQTKIDKVTIHWPGAKAGPPQVLTDLAIDREHLIQQAP